MVSRDTQMGGFRGEGFIGEEVRTTEDTEPTEDNPDEGPARRSSVGSLPSVVALCSSEVAAMQGPRYSRRPSANRRASSGAK